jgi:predicted deacetylase
MPTDPRYAVPRTYRLSEDTLAALGELGRTLQPGVILSDRQVIEAVILGRLKAEQRKAARATRERPAAERDPDLMKPVPCPRTGRF